MGDRPVALVTGGASGIGAALVRRLADDHDVVVVDRDKDQLEAIAKEVGGHPVVVDLTEANAAERAVAAAVDKYGQLNVVCLNAGRTTGEHDVQKIDPDRYRAV